MGKLSLVDTNDLSGLGATEKDLGPEWENEEWGSGSTNGDNLVVGAVRLGTRSRDSD
jgi:hypothetical protein